MNTGQLQGDLSVTGEVPLPAFIELSVPYDVPFKIKVSPGVPQYRSQEQCNQTYAEDNLKKDVQF